MRIASIGDLHLTASHRQDKHWGPEGPLLAFLEHLAGGHDQVVLLGDVCQADFGWRLGQDPEVVTEVERRYRRSFELIRGGPFVRVEGNHDRTPAGPARFPLRAPIEHGGWRILFEHGHRFDRTVFGLFPDLMMWTMGRLRWLGLRRLCDFWEEVVLERVHGWATGDALERGAEGLVRDERWDVVVMGHTHRMLCAPAAGGMGLYANAGACTARHPRFVSIDTGAATVSIRELDGRDTSRTLIGFAARDSSAERWLEMKP